RLFNRLKPSSIRHRRRYRARTSAVAKSLGLSEVTRITQSAASSVCFESWTASLCVPARLASRVRSRLHRLLDGDQTQSERCAALAFYPDRPIDQPADCRLTQLGDEIEHITFGIEPARALPAGPDHDVRPGFEQGRHAVRLQIGAIGKANLSSHRRYPVERLARLLIGQLEVAKAFLRQIERAVDAPHLVFLPGLRSFLRHRSGIDDADHSSSARWRGSGRKHLTHQHCEPVPALT